MGGWIGYDNGDLNRSGIGMRGVGKEDQAYVPIAAVDMSKWLT